MTRGQFSTISSIGAGGLCAGCSPAPHTREPDHHVTGNKPSLHPDAKPHVHRSIKPPRLRPGDHVALVTPAGPIHSAKELERAELQVRRLGLVPIAGKHIADRYGYLAGSDTARADDFNRLARDPKVRAIFAVRGGYGTMRILDLIDYAAFVSDPKIVLGFSDITALLNAITARTGLVTFHGPALAHSMPAFAVQALRAATMNAEPIGRIALDEPHAIAGGRASGVLAGGNLSIVAALAGGPYAVPTTGSMLLLEDVREAPYRIDRMLTTLRMNGDLARTAGIALGAFPLCVPGEGDDVPSLTIHQVLEDRVSDLRRPALRGLRVGHIEQQYTIPLGVRATLDAERGVFTVDEAAVE